MTFGIRFRVVWHGLLGDQSVCWFRAVGWVS